MVESALIFETKHSGDEKGEGWRQRFDRVILVTAPDEVKIARFVARAAGETTLTDREGAELEAEAQRRLEQQIPDEQKAALCDYVLTNGGPLTELGWQVDQLWPILKDTAV
jgi:dephospho-CoA kinase